MSIQSYPRVIVQGTSDSKNPPSGFCMMYFDGTNYVPATPTALGYLQLVDIANNTAFTPNGLRISETLEENGTGYTIVQFAKKSQQFAQWNTFRTKVFDSPSGGTINLDSNGEYPVKLVFQEDGMAIQALKDVLLNSVRNFYAETTGVGDPVVNRGAEIVSVGTTTDDFFSSIQINKGHFTAYYLSNPQITP